jgi:hypothetical protein
MAKFFRSDDEFLVRTVSLTRRMPFASRLVKHFFSEAGKNRTAAS